MRIFALTATVLALTAAALPAVPLTVIPVPEPGFYPEFGVVLSGLLLYAAIRRRK